MGKMKNQLMTGIENMNNNLNLVNEPEYQAKSVDANDIATKYGGNILKKQLLEQVDIDTAINNANFIDKNNCHNIIKQIIPYITLINAREYAKAHFKDDDFNDKHAEIYVILADYTVKLCEKTNFYLGIKPLINDKSDKNVYIFNGKYWEKLNLSDLIDLVKVIIEYTGYTQVKYKSNTFQDGVLKTLYKYIPKTPKPDLNKKLLNLENGILEFMPNGNITLHKHSHEYFLDYCLSYPYDPTAEAPGFNNFIQQISLNDVEVINILQESAGAIHSHKKLEKIIILYGGGSNGKSTYLQIIQAVLGQTNVSNMTMKDLICGDKAENNRAQLIDKKLNISTELDSNGIRDHALIKTLASREPITVKYLYANTFTTDNYAMLWFACNDLPKNVEHNHGFFRRFLLIPFNYKIEERNQDFNLISKIIKNELSGILNWIVEGHQRLDRNNGFSHCNKSNELMEEYKANTNNVILFMQEMNYIPDRQRSKLFKNVYKDYLNYCNEYKYKAVSNKEFSKRLQALNYKIDKGNQNKSIIYLKENDAN
jgi:putative DNA primase/helicase